MGIASWLPTLLGLLGLAVMIPSGGLGGALVYEHGMGGAPATTRPEPGRRRAA